MPSKSILAEKEALVAKLADKIKGSTAGVLVNYTGINVDQDTKMRVELRKAGVEYKVYKNSMTERALDITGYGGMKEHLVGMTALALSGKDPIAPAKILKEFAEKIEKFEIKAGFVEGRLINAKEVNDLAEIPSKEALIAKMMGSLQSSLYGLCYVLQAKIDKENGVTPEAVEA